MNSSVFNLFDFLSHIAYYTAELTGRESAGENRVPSSDRTREMFFIGAGVTTAVRIIKIPVRSSLPPSDTPLLAADTRDALLRLYSLRFPHSEIV
jgi:hypothetical protein